MLQPIVQRDTKHRKPKWGRGFMYTGPCTHLYYNTSLKTVSNYDIVRTSSNPIALFFIRKYDNILFHVKEQTADLLCL